MASFKTAPVVTDEVMDRIENAAFDILEDVGIEVPHSGIVDVLSRVPGAHVNGDIVRYDREVVRDMVSNVPPCLSYDTKCIAGGYCHTYLDPETGQTRESTAADLVKSLKYCEALGVGACAPVIPMDIPGPRQEIVMERAAHEYCTRSYGAGQATHPASAEAGLRMSELVGRPHGLEQWTDSPLRMNGICLDISWKLRHMNPAIRIAGMPTLGMSGPLSLGSVFALSVAECFGSVTTLRLSGVGKTVSYRIDAFNAYSVDMRTMTVLLSGPDYLRLLTIANEIGKRQGIKVQAGKAMLTSSKLPDAQAGAEKAGQCMALALAGADCYMAPGLLALDEIFSPAQLVIDLEIIDSVNHFMKPINFDDIDVEEIREVGPGGYFMTQESTVRNMRDFFFAPKLFSTSPLAAWQMQGCPDLVGKAKEYLDSLVLREEPVVSSEIRRELHAIEEHFSSQLR